jgi:hypothetical protein
LESKYDKVDVKSVAQQQTHLNKEQQYEMHLIFKQRTKLFSGKLSFYPHKKMHLGLQPDAKPVHVKPYPIPRTQLEVFRKELEQLGELGVLSWAGGTEWASPTFIIPKRSQRV